MQSFTDPADGILNYPGWQLTRQGRTTETKVLQSRPHGKGLVVRLEGVDNREDAALMTGAEIAITQDALPPLESGYYWRELIGTRVENTEGDNFGVVGTMMETGANDVLVIRGDRERLVPWIDHVIVKVDLENGKILVDWDVDF